MNITHCDVCNNEIKTGFTHHATLRFLNPLQSKKDPENSYVYEGGEGDFCGKCMKMVLKFFRRAKEYKELLKNADFNF
jgi:hypothetical protein